MRLYHCRNARSFRPLWAIEELGLDCELVTMVPAPRVKYPAYLEVNPLGTIPALVDGSLVMTESSGICHYLADKVGDTPLRVAPDEPRYGEYLNWLYRSDATLTFPLTLVLRYTRMEPPERQQPQVAQDYSIWFLGRLRAVEAALEGHAFLCADRFTMADVAVHYALMLADSLGLGERIKPNSREYLERLKLRPAYQRALARQEIITEPADFVL